MKKLVAILFNLTVGVLLASAIGGGGWAAVGIGAGLSVVRTGATGLTMAIQKEIWENDIVEALWANNQFLQYAFNADQYVLAGKVVHIPQAGTSVSVSTNRSSLPASVTTRTDTEINYSLDELTSEPIRIPNADTVELSYDKRNSVLSDTKMSIAEAAALNLLFKWNPTASGNIIRTTGSAVAAHTDSATGNRKAFSVADVKAAQKQFNKWNIPTNDRYMLIDADMYDQLTADLSATQYRDFSAALDVSNGVVGKLYSFNIMMRSSVARYTNASTPVPVLWSAAGDAAHNAAALCWHKNSVERALGMVNFFEDLGNPTYYGDIYSALVRVGGRIRRNDAKGVLAIVQAATT
ncbi:MAG: phage capsid protein [Paludibacter sp.]|jgi:hypothetical protein|nr:phage capsid protein [Paludibacter sp.]